MRILMAIFLAMTAIFIGGCAVFFAWFTYSEYGFYIWDFAIFIPFLIVAVLLVWLAWWIGRDPPE